MITSKLEVLVDFGTLPDEASLNKALKELKTRDGIKQAQFKDGAFMVETTLPSSVVLDLVTKTTGKRSVLQGFGETQSAVAMVSSQPPSNVQVMGIVRFQQTPEGPLVIDGTIDGLTPGEHGLSVHESGDLSQGCKSIGNIYDPNGVTKDSGDKKVAGDLGNFAAASDGRATFRIVDNVLKVWDIVGRSVAVTDKTNKTNPTKIHQDSWARVACGIIARSAGIFQNPKRICACDGVVVWDERDRPLAGKGRRMGGGETERETADVGDERDRPLAGKGRRMGDGETKRETADVGDERDRPLAGKGRRMGDGETAHAGDKHNKCCCK